MTIAEENRNYRVFIYGLVPVFLVVVWFFVPIFSSFVLMIFLVFVKAPRFVVFMFLALSSVSLGLIKYTKLPVSDLLQYYDWFEEFNNKPVWSFQDVRPLDPFFYFITSIVSHAALGNRPVFVLFWTSITYVLAMYSVLKVSYALNLSRRWAIGICLYLLFFGFEFSMAGHLVRQYFAMSMLMMSLSYCFSSKYLSYLFFLGAAFSHFSIMLFFPLILFLNNFSFNFKKTSYLSMLFLILVLGFFIGQLNVFEYILSVIGSSVYSVDVLLMKSKSLVDVEAESISWRRVVDYGLVSIALLYVFILDNRFNNKSLSKILFFVVYFWFLFFLSFYFPIMNLRIFFYGIGLFCLVLVPLSRSNSMILRGMVLLLIVSAFPRFLRSFNSWGWEYGGDVEYILFSSFWHFL